LYFAYLGSFYSYEEAIVNARELERQKQEQVISELKQRNDALLLLRQELESRSKQYSRELQVRILQNLLVVALDNRWNLTCICDKDLRVEHEEVSSHLKTQLSSAQEESNRLREHHNIARSKIAGLETDVKNCDLEMQDLRQRYRLTSRNIRMLNQLMK
jgi:hypothetical protein